METDDAAEAPEPVPDRVELVQVDQVPMTAVEFAMTPPPLCTETDAQHCEWDDPLTRLLLLLELADEPAWLREVAAARTGAGRETGRA